VRGFLYLAQKQV